MTPPERVDLSGCPLPTTTKAGPATISTAGPCRDSTEVILYTVEGGNHDSPLGSATGGSRVTADVPLVVKFLLSRARAAAR